MRGELGSVRWVLQPADDMWSTTKHMTPLYPSLHSEIIDSFNSFNTMKGNILLLRAQNDLLHAIPESKLCILRGVCTFHMRSEIWVTSTLCNIPASPIREGNIDPQSIFPATLLSRPILAIPSLIVLTCINDVRTRTSPRRTYNESYPICDGVD
jgi:hypothetical protein